MKSMDNNKTQKQSKGSVKTDDGMDTCDQVQHLLDYFSKLDKDTREFYIKTILRIYYLLNETK